MGFDNRMQPGSVEKSSTERSILVQALNCLLQFASLSALGDRGTRGSPLPVSQPHHLLHMLLYQKASLRSRSTLQGSALPCMLKELIAVRHCWQHKPWHCCHSL